MNATQKQETERKNQEILRKLVDREVIHCCSMLIYDLLKTPELKGEYKYEDLLDICTGYDYENAAWDEGWRKAESPDLAYNFIQENDEEPNETSTAEDWQELCDEQCIEPYDQEVLEHWIVTRWFAEKLKEHGEIVGEIFDFHVWGRCCSGQAILLDGVIREIANEMEILVGQKNDWSKN